MPYDSLSEQSLTTLRDLADRIEADPTLSASCRRDLALLLQAREALMRRALVDGKITRKHAVDLRTAAAVAILLFAPVRLSNLAAIELGRHLRLPRRTNEPAYLHFEEHEVKNRVALDFELPPPVVRAISTYLERGRPQLMDVADPHLFYKGSGRLRACALAHWIRQRLRDVTGLRVDAHLLRQLSAKFLSRRESRPT